MEKEKVSSYIGETGKSGYERGVNHQDDYKRLQLDSHILKHQVLQHREGEKVEFTMKIVKKFQSAFKRQVYEAVHIEMEEGKGRELLNSKGGFNRCTLPRLTIKMGDKEARQGDLEEKEMSEYEIELEIHKMRKNLKMRRRGEEETRPANPGHEGAPPTKKKRIWSNFGTGRKRKKQEEEPREKMKLAEEKSADEGVCDNSEKEKEVTTVHEGLLHNFNKNDFSTHHMNGIKPNLITNISSLEKGKKFKGGRIFL